MHTEILNKLKQFGDPKVAIISARFFKEPINLFGLKSVDVKKITREYAPRIDMMKKSDVWKLVEGLLKKNYLESSSMAAEFVYRVRDKFEKSDFKIFENWMDKYITNWANCDVFCNHSMNALIEKYPDLIRDIKQWTESKNRWMRRGVAVTFILSARQGRFIDDVFNIADALLMDSDDMVQKGYGWALKAAGEFAPKRVYDFVTSRVQKIPRTAYRYAIEKLPDDMRKSAMKI